MKALLDESVTWELRRRLTGHDVYTAKYLGWDGKRNGELLDLAAKAGFDVLITVDQGIPNQQNLSENDVAVIVMVAKSNSISHLQPLLPKLMDSLNSIKRGQVVEIRAQDS